MNMHFSTYKQETETVRKWKCTCNSTINCSWGWGQGRKPAGTVLRRWGWDETKSVNSEGTGWGWGQQTWGRMGTEA